MVRLDWSRYIQEDKRGFAIKVAWAKIVADVH